MAGFVDELVKVAAVPAPVAVPATGRAMGTQAGAPNEAIGPTNAYRAALPQQAMMSPPKVPQDTFRPTAGPKVNAQPAPTSPAPKTGTGQVKPAAADNRKPFESELGYQARNAGEKIHNAGMAADAARSAAPKPVPRQEGAPLVEPGAAKPTQVIPRESPKMGVPMAQATPGQRSTPANSGAPNSSKAAPFATPTSSPVAMPKPVKPPSP